MLAPGSIFPRKGLKISNDLGKKSLGKSGTRHFKGWYVVSSHNWIQTNLRSDVNVFDFGKADLELMFWEAISTYSVTLATRARVVLRLKSSFRWGKLKEY